MPHSAEVHTHTVTCWARARSFTGNRDEVVDAWGGGFWNLAEFTLQMSMILLGGFVVATSPPVKWLLMKLIGFVNSPTQAVLFCTLIAMVASWVNWGFGLVIGGVVALEVGKRMPPGFRFDCLSHPVTAVSWFGMPGYRAQFRCC